MSCDEAADSYWKKPDGKELLILPDAGAILNTCGMDWALKATAYCKRIGLPMKWIRTPTRGHGGVGSATSDWQIEFPISIGTHVHRMNVSVLSAPSSGVPCLLGVRDMGKLDIWISTRSGNIYLPGPGGATLQCSPGTEIVQMINKHHWYLRVCEHLEKTNLTKQKKSVFITHSKELLDKARALNLQHAIEQTARSPSH